MLLEIICQLFSKLSLLVISFVSVTDFPIFQVSKHLNVFCREIENMVVQHKQIDTPHTETPSTSSSEPSAASYPVPVVPTAPTEEVEEIENECVVCLDKEVGGLFMLG